MKCKILFIPAFSLALAACNSFEANFDQVPKTDEEPDAALSSMEISGQPMADGESEASIVLRLRSTSNLPMPNVSMSISVSGSGNLVIPCTKSDAHGRSRCGLLSTVSELKTVTAWGPINLVGHINFLASKHNRNSFGIVSSSNLDVLPTGRRVVTGSGTIESAPRIQDSNNSVRLFSSILSLILGE